MLGVGSYTVSVTHGGEYLGDDPKSITLASRETASLTWLTGARQAQQVTISSPGSLDSSSVSYTIVQGGTTVQSGSMWNATMTFNLYPGAYTLTLNAFGDTVTKEFTVPKTSGLTLDIADQFCQLSVSDSGGYGVKNITVRGYSCSSTTSYKTTQTLYILRSSKSASIGGTVNTPTPPSYSGVSTAKIYTFSVSGGSITPNAGSRSILFTVSKVANLVFITSDGTLTVPSGTYNVLINGGGGGSIKGYTDSYRYGANGGEIKRYKGALNGAYSITLGAGGVADGTSGKGNGGASSFGTLLSASGGSSVWNVASSSNVGVSGGADAENAGIETRGGQMAVDTTGDIGGGGGGSGAIYDPDDDIGGTGGQGGKGGTIGGDGGNGGGQTSSGYVTVASTGSIGTSVTIGGTSYPANGGARGANAGTSYTMCGGGGGGGGYGAKGGRGGDGGYNGWPMQGGGGGGGGALGGHGGDGGGYNNSSTPKAGSPGRGYGAGKGGNSYVSGSTSSYSFFGGGGGGGIGSSQIATTSAGAKGCVAIWWVS